MKAITIEIANLQICIDAHLAKEETYAETPRERWFYLKLIAMEEHLKALKAHKALREQ